VDVLLPLAFAVGLVIAIFFAARWAFQIDRSERKAERKLVEEIEEWQQEREKR
jgi:nitrogen fixation-related uncharacterized protein